MQPRAEESTDAEAAFTESVQDELLAIERRLLAVTESRSELVAEMARHVIAAGGKRFRPMLVLLASRFGDGPAPERLLDAAVVVELTHVASLYHDDVMDSAEVRRGVASANSRWGNLQAILVGDFLFARASAVVARLGAEYVQIQAETFTRLVHGQIAETVGPAGADALGHYLQVVADKTASLMATSARFGAMVAGAPDDVVEVLSRFGEEIGTAFQLSDDILDVTGENTGKAPGTDLREGVPTLPTLLLGSGPGDRDLRARIEGDLSDDAELAIVLAELRSHPVMDRARDEVARRAGVARDLLDPLEPGAAKDALLALCDQVVTRTR